MSHTLAANLGAGNFDAALIANNSLRLTALILTAIAFPVLCRAENAFAEQSVPLGLQRTIVYGFGLFNFAVRPFEYLFRRCKTYLYSIEIGEFEHCFLSLRSPCVTANRRCLPA